MAQTGDQKEKEGKPLRFGGMKEKVPNLISVIGDEDTCVGFLLAGIGEVNKSRHANFFVVDQLTPKGDIEDCFRRFVRRQDIDVILINRFAADMIRKTIDTHVGDRPDVMEIPSRSQPYIPEKDPVLMRARTHFFSEDN